MSDLKAYFEWWVANHKDEANPHLPAEVAADHLATRFKKDAAEAGYSPDEREDEIGIVNLAIREAIEGPSFYQDRVEALDETPSIEPGLGELVQPSNEAEADDPTRGP